ncbi:MAG: 4Fe-4S binding protein [Chloroflexi bacterium]|nr:4Fe-4S binding protein [Chloroflexota bacterium]
MKIKTVLGDMLSSLQHRPTTRLYPFVRRPVPIRLRGRLQWDPEKCTGCCLCVKDCPADAIEMITIDKANKRFVMRYHADRCVYCSQCTQNCRFKCLSMSSEQWEHAARSKEAFTVYFGRQEDIDAFLGKRAAPAAEPAAEAVEPAPAGQSDS